MLTDSINYFKLRVLKNKYNNVRFGKNIIVLGKLPFIKLFKDSQFNIGNNVILNSDFEHSNTALTTRCKFVLGYVGKLSIGDNTMLNGVSITAYKNVSIGSNCQIASSTLITDTDFHPVDPSVRLMQVTKQNYDINTVNKKDVYIGDNVWICWGCIILKGTHIGNNSVVAAGSVVLGDFPDNVVIAGNPAKVVKKI